MQLGIVKILTYSITLIVIHYADIATLSADIAGVWIREIGVGYLAINEALSCLKHLSSFWVPLPKLLIQKLEGYRDNLDSKDFK
jgi:phage-related holin